MNGTETAENKSGWTFQRYLLLGGGGLGIVILLPLIIGILVAVIADPEPTAIRFGMIRDIVLIVLAMQGILVVLALVTLILQVARLVALLQNEVKPIIDDTKEAAQTAKGTAQFVGRNVTQPVISAKSFVFGFGVFVRELIGIRRALRTGKDQ